MIAFFSYHILLTRPQNYQQLLDITNDLDEHVLFKVSGTHAVYLTGSCLVDAQGFSDDDEIDRDEEDEEYDIESDSDELDDYNEEDELDELNDGLGQSLRKLGR